MKKLLIISPYFPPSNTPDMQRIRMSLPYFESYGWEAEVVMVDQKYSDTTKDDLLALTIPSHIKIHTVKAFSKKWTSRFGLGNLALRSLWFYRQKVNKLLRVNQYNLIYFSTTQFTVCTLGTYWKRKFGVPYVIDMQDPWYSTHYLDKPKVQRPPKYRLTYGMHKYLEPIAIKNADGLISVSSAYIDDLIERYPEIQNTPSAVITFGAFGPDIEIAENNKDNFADMLDKDTINIVYAGRGGTDMYNAITPFFKALKTGLQTEPELYKQLKFYFIGTSYAPDDTGIPTISPLAEKHGVEEQVTEITDRISYYHVLNTLQQADALFIAGSDDPKYSASKIYPYLLARKPLLSIFNPQSPVVEILEDYGSPYSYTYEDIDLEDKIAQFLKQVINKDIAVLEYHNDALQKYDAKNLTKLQCDLFEQALLHAKN